MKQRGIQEIEAWNKIMGIINCEIVNCEITTGRNPLYFEANEIDRNGLQIPKIHKKA